MSEELCGGWPVLFAVGLPRAVWICGSGYGRFGRSFGRTLRRFFPEAIDRSACARVVWLKRATGLVERRCAVIEREPQRVLYSSLAAFRMTRFRDEDLPRHNRAFR